MLERKLKVINMNKVRLPEGGRGFIPNWTRCRVVILTLRDDLNGGSKRLLRDDDFSSLK